MVKWIIYSLAIFATTFAAPAVDDVHTNTQSQIRPKFDCKEVGGDGNYAFGCSSTFYQCSNGIRYVQQCRKDNVFDPETNACQLPRGIKVCSPEEVQSPRIIKANTEELMTPEKRASGYPNAFTGVQQSPPVLPQRPSQPRNNYNSQPQMTPPVRPRQPQEQELFPALPEVQPEFDCSTRANGVYPAQQGGCVNFFWKCANGQTFKYNCPKGLFFSVADVECHKRENIAECNGQQQSPPMNVPLEWKPAQPSDQYVPQQPVQQAPPAPAQPREQYVPQQPAQQAPRANYEQQQVAPQQPIQQAPPAPAQPSYNQQPVQQAPPAPRGYNQEQQAPPAPVQPRDPYAPQQPVQQAPPKAQLDWCQRNNAQDGYQGEGCSAHYWYCAAGTTTKMHCPSGLWFDIEVHACDHKEHIPNCGGQRPTPPPQQAPPLFDCSGKTDGFYYNSACESKFFRCHDGRMYNQVCNPGLVFNPNENACDYPERCTDLKPAQDQPQQPMTPYGDHGNFNSYLQQSEKPKVQQAPPKTVNFDCTGKADGFYEQGKCKPEYIHCANGFAHAITCPSGLVFGNEMCDYSENCLNPKPVQQAPPAPVQTRDQYAPQQPQTQMQPPQPAQPRGTYNQQQIQTAPPAPAPRGYNQQQQAPPAPVQPSYNQKPVQQTPPAPVQPRDPYAPQQPVQQAPPKAPLENWCQRNNAQDGYQGEGCSAHYWYCAAGTTTKMHCPPGLWFDIEVHACDHKEVIPSCGGQRPTQQAPTRPPMPRNPYGQQQVETYAPQPQQPIQQQPPAIPADNYCQRKNLDNGFHGEGCQNFFYVCSSSSTTKINCPAGLWYDLETHSCDLKELIAACGGRRPTQPPQQAPTRPPMSRGPYGQQQVETYAPQPQQQPARPLFDCSGKTDGVFVNGCSSNYFACNHGVAHALQCPTNTFYSAHTERCDYREHVVECGGKAPTQQPPVARDPVILPRDPYAPQPQQPQQQSPVVTPAPAWVAHPYQPSQPQPQQPQAQQPKETSPSMVESVNTNPCMNLSNGIYGRKCSRFFFVCTNLKTYDFICPRDQAFDIKTSKCAAKTKIETCPEFLAQPQQQQPMTQAQTYPYGRQ